MTSNAVVTLPLSEYKEMEEKIQRAKENSAAWKAEANRFKHIIFTFCGVDTNTGRYLFENIKTKDLLDDIVSSANDKDIVKAWS